MIGFIATLRVITLMVFELATHPKLGIVIWAWNVVPEFVDIIVETNGPVIPYPNHSTVVPVGYPEANCKESITPIIISAGEHRVVSEILNLGPML